MFAVPMIGFSSWLKFCLLLQTTFAGSVRACMHVMCIHTTMRRYTSDIVSIVSCGSDVRATLFICLGQPFMPAGDNGMSLTAHSITGGGSGIGS